MTKHHAVVTLSFIYEIPVSLLRQYFSETRAKQYFSETRAKNYDTVPTNQLRKKLRKEIISDPQKYQKIRGYFVANKETEKSNKKIKVRTKTWKQCKSP